MISVGSSSDTHEDLPTKSSVQQCTPDKEFKNRIKQLSLCFADTKLPNCETASQPACLEDNYSGLGNTTRTRLQDALNNLAPVLNTSCSVNLKKFACFIETAPCVTNDGSTLRACQSLCKEVGLKCGEELKRHGISFPQCIHNYPEFDAGNGLCQLSQWPVPWPAKLKQNPGLFYNVIT